MAKKIMIVCAAIILCGCGEETRVIYDHSAGTKFANALTGGKNGKSLAASGWKMEVGGQQPQAKSKEPAPEMIGSTNNFQNLHFSTSFQTDSPEGAQTQPAGGSSFDSVGSSPWSAPPASPGH